MRGRPSKEKIFVPFALIMIKIIKKINDKKKPAIKTTQ
jgi:hypothetical protein